MIITIRYMMFYFIYKLISSKIYFDIADKFGYNNIYTISFDIIDKILTLSILLFGIYYFVKNVSHK